MEKISMQKYSLTYVWKYTKLKIYDLIIKKERIATFENVNKYGVDVC